MLITVKLNACYGVKISKNSNRGARARRAGAGSAFATIFFSFKNIFTPENVSFFKFLLAGNHLEFLPPGKLGGAYLHHWQ